MKIVYEGPDSRGVTLAPVTGTVVFPHGEPVEVDDDLGRKLIAQGTFTEHRPKRRKGGSDGGSSAAGSDTEGG